MGAEPQDSALPPASERDPSDRAPTPSPSLQAGRGAKARVGILISGRGSNMAALVEASRAPDCPFEVVLVASNVPDAPGLAFAREAGIATWAESHRGMPREAFDGRVDEALRAHHVTHVALAGYMRLLSPWLVERWAGRMVNIHPALLPAYKGLDTHARVLAAGEARHGATVHLVTAALDDGPTLLQADVPVLPADTAETLAARVLEVEHRIYPEALAMLVRGEHDLTSGERNG